MLNSGFFCPPEPKLSSPNFCKTLFLSQNSVPKNLITQWPGDDQTSQEAGKATEAGEKIKFSHYQDLASQFIIVPVATETVGTWGIVGLKFLKDLGKQIIAATGGKGLLATCSKPSAWQSREAMWPQSKAQFLMLTKKNSAWKFYRENSILGLFGYRGYCFPPLMMSCRRRGISK